MPKVQYKNKTGALHVGGGRFFYANKPVDVTDKEWALLEDREDLELVTTDKAKGKGSTSDTEKDKKEPANEPDNPAATK
ncbi:hypothetical protein [Paenibacillus xylanilyticus]|uniref:Uncharacterized protein n=1 Tax=Paenibacillus xylanilyticus TaxID=248903 RepID=A0A7Y6ETQ9_9BACL|nr:hypothetical protein [Paenibacillus xylanilyticus]NUU74018.1 hypothetical protein [Paenibacillus xylanilyticus]